VLPAPDYKLFFMMSPYCRSRQTFVAMRQAFKDRHVAGIQVGKHEGERGPQPASVCVHMAPGSQLGLTAFVCVLLQARGSPTVA
jgi:hypothetical protein